MGQPEWEPVRAFEQTTGACLVKLAFATIALRSLCEQQAKAERVLGMKVAEKLRERLADMEAADNVLELLAGRPREVPGNPLPHYAVDLADGFRLVFAANHNDVPMLKKGRVDWKNVS